MRTNRCLWCQNSIYLKKNILQLFSSKDLLCVDCRNKLDVINQKRMIYGYETLIIYKYNNDLADILFQYKQMYDISLAPIFLYGHYFKLIKFIGLTKPIYLAPSSKVNYQQRQFNTLQHIFYKLNKRLESPFIKLSDKQQKQLTKSQRQQIQIMIKPNYLLKKSCILVDDVYTSGATIHACIQALINQGVKDIKIVLIAK